MDSKAADPLLTKKEVATLWRVGLRTVERWVELKRLRGVRIGGTVRFRRSEVLRSADRYQYGDSDRHDPAMG
jgi:excisionase family DNA binding protein